MKILQKAYKLKRPKGSTHLAILFKGSHILEHAWNDRSKTKGICARYGFWNATPHAEVAVVLKYIKKHSKQELRKTKMLVLRYSLKEGELGASKPCEMCFKFLKTFPVNDVLWLDSVSALRKASKE